MLGVTGYRSCGPLAGSGVLWDRPPPPTDLVGGPAGRREARLLAQVDDATSSGRRRQPPAACDSGLNRHGGTEQRAVQSRSSGPYSHGAAGCTVTAARDSSVLSQAA